jgi:hypothetical protein
MKAGFDFTTFGSSQRESKTAKREKEVPKPTTDKKKVISIKSLTENAEEKQFENMIKKVEAKAQLHVEKFRQSMQLSIQLPEAERIRQKIRENFFYSLVFGLEELKIKENTNSTSGTPTSFSETREFTVEIAKFLMRDEKGQLEQIKNLTLSIEANLYHKYNKDVSKSSIYSSKSRLVGPPLTRSS